MALGTLGRHGARYGEDLAKLFDDDKDDARYYGMVAFESLKQSFFSITKLTTCSRRSY